MKSINFLPFETKIRFVSEFILKLVNFLIIPVITYGIGIKEYGNFIVVTCLINGLLPIFLLGFNFSIIKKLAVSDGIRYDSKKLFNCLFLITLISIFFLMISSLITEIYFNYFLYFNIFVVLISYSTAIQHLFFEFLRSKNKSNFFSYFQIFDSFSLFLIILLFFLFNELDFFRLLFLICIVKILCFSLIFLYLLKQGLIKIKYFRFEKNIFKNYIFPGFIFIALGVSEWFINFSDKLILNNFLSSLSLGIYFTAAMFSGILNSIGSVFWWDLFPKLMKFKKINDYDSIYNLIKKKNSLFINFSLVLSLVLIIISPSIQYLILNSTFKINHFLYLFFFISVFTHQISTGWEFFCYIKNKEKFILANSIFWGIISFILYSILIPEFQIRGAIFSLVIVKFGYSLSLRKYSMVIGYKEELIEKTLYLKFIYFFISFAIFLGIFNLDILDFGLPFNDLIYCFITLLLFYSFSKIGKYLFKTS